jgi:hypothetical protein
MQPLHHHQVEYWQKVEQVDADLTQEPALAVLLEQET